MTHLRQRALREYERQQASGAEIERKRQESERAKHELAQQHAALIRGLIIATAIALPIWWFLWALVSWANRAGFWQWAATIFDGGLK